MTRVTMLRSRRRTPRGLLVLLAALLTVPVAVAMAGPASAHTKLVSSNPAEGAALDAPPTQVVLTFNEVPKSVTSVKAQDTNGPLVALGDPVLDGTTVRVSWPQDQAPGLFRLVYVLVSDDGDPVEGTLLFSYDGAGGPTASAASSASGSADASSSAIAAADTGSGAGGAGLVRVSLVVLAALVGLLVLTASRRRRTPTPDGPAPALDRESSDA